ncbi:WD40 repeat domain-containing protein [Nonomuraea polychroma]|nr:hypothetical protein [Nonomuraea polychroma]
MDKLAALDIEGAPGVLGADRAGTVWTWNLVTGERRKCCLDLDAAGPEEQIPDLDGEIWDEYHDLQDPFADFGADPGYTVSLLATGHVNHKPVAVTGGGFRDLTAILGPEYGGGAVRVWDLETGRKIGKTLTGPSTDIYSLATVRAEGCLLAIALYEDELLAWNLTSGERMARFGVMAGRATAATLSGRPVAVTVNGDAGLQLWDLLSGQMRSAIPAAAERGVTAIAITEVNDRAVALTASQAGCLSAWDLLTGERTCPPMSGHENAVRALAAAGVFAVTGAQDGTARVWDLANGIQVGDALTVHRDEVWAAAIAEIDGRPVAVTGGLEGAVGIWELPTV